MGCGSNSDGNGGNDFLGCVCSVLADILDRQDDSGNNNNGCVNDFCGNGNNNHETIPVIITTKANTLLFGFIDLDMGTPDCQPTIYFRVNNVNENTGCVQLEMLRPEGGRQIQPGAECCIRLNQVCTGGDLVLERTGQCIFADCDCLCTVQCIDPGVVMDNGNGGASARRRRAANTNTNTEH